ncbi:MAG: hypothetical protein QXI59_07565 [Candidatus Bathyarchaeia archaeon]
MPSWSGVAAEPPQSIYQKAAGVISGQGMKLISTIPNQSITAEGSRDFNPLIMAILVIVGIITLPFLIGIILLLAALIYFLVSGKNVFTVGMAPTGTGGSQVTITANGSKAEAALNQMVGVIQLSFTGTGAPRNCRSCGTLIADPTAAFCPSCGAKQI